MKLDFQIATYKIQIGRFDTPSFNLQILIYENGEV